MAIDPLTEEILSLSCAARRLPRLRNDRPVSPATLWRWAARGVRDVRLETIKIGGATCTSVEALQRFIAALNGRPSPTTKANRVKHDEAVERELSTRGI
jgi:hypothetical protein